MGLPKSQLGVSGRLDTGRAGGRGRGPPPLMLPYLPSLLQQTETLPLKRERITLENKV